MTWAFLIDANLPFALIKALDGAGYHAIHVLDLELADSDDDVIWQVAADRGLVIVSKDSDFADKASAAEPGPPVVWIRVGNTRKTALLCTFVKHLADIVAALERSERLIEVR